MRHTKPSVESQKKIPSPLQYNFPQGLKGLENIYFGYATYTLCSSIIELRRERSNLNVTDVTNVIITTFRTNVVYVITVINVAVLLMLLMLLALLMLTMLPHY